MTNQQLHLLLEYINTKASMATKRARGDGVSPHDYDRLASIVCALETLIEESEDEA